MLVKKILDNKIFKIFYGIIRAFITVILVSYVAFVLVQRITNNSAIMGYRVFTVVTGSMEPVYNVNDVILVKEVDIDTIKVGDDIAYLANSDSFAGMYVTHRVVEIKEENGEKQFILKGINNDVEDPAITAEQIYGRVEGKVFLVNYVNHIVKNIYGFFFLVFCPLVLVIFLEIAYTIIDIKIEKGELVRIDNKDKLESGDVDEEII